MELVYTVVTLNGRGFMFVADDVDEVCGEYVFSLEGEIVAQFKEEAIAGYFITRVEDDEEAEG